MAVEDATTGVIFAPGQAYYDHFLTNFFLPVIADARNNSSVLWSLIKKQTYETVSGRYITHPVRFGRNTGRNAFRPGGDLPDPGSQGGNTYSYETRTIPGRVKIEGEIFRRGRPNGGAYLDAQLMEIQGQADDYMVEQNRICHNDGSGRMSEIAPGFVAGATTPIDVVVNQDIEGAAGTAGMAQKYFEVGDRIAFTTNDGSGGGTIRPHSGTGQRAFYVVGVPTSGQIQVALTPGGTPINSNTITGLTGADWIVRASNTSTTLGFESTAHRAEPMGIAGIFSDAGVLDGNGPSGMQQTGSQAYAAASTATATFQGLLADATVPFNRAVVLDSGSSGPRPISEALMQQAFSDAEELNNAVIELILSGYATYNSYLRLLTPEKRYNDTLNLQGGHKTLSFNGVMWVKDRFCYPNRAYMMNLSELTVYETEPLGPLTYMDVPRWERLGNKDAYWTGIITSYNLGVNVRQRVGALLTDLAA